MATKIEFINRLKCFFNCKCSSGLFDKNGVELRLGDTIRVNIPSRSYQTHYGENIPFPCGYYTEPLELIIETMYLTVRFSNGMFWAEPDEDDGRNGMYGDGSPLFWLLVEHKTREDLISVFESYCDSWINEEHPEEGDLEYLLSEYSIDSEDELMKYVSGCEVVSRG